MCLLGTLPGCQVCHPLKVKYVSQNMTGIYVILSVYIQKHSRNEEDKKEYRDCATLPVVLMRFDRLASPFSSKGALLLFQPDHV